MLRFLPENAHKRTIEDHIVIYSGFLVDRGRIGEKLGIETDMRFSEVKPKLKIAADLLKEDIPMRSDVRLMVSEAIKNIGLFFLKKDKEEAKPTASTATAAPAVSILKM